MPTAAEYTVWDIAELTIPPYSVRGLSESLELDFEPDITRDWNGNAVDLTPPQFRKYRTTVTCTDMDSPPIDGVWTGMEVTVDCVTELCYETSSAGGNRTAVPGSERVDAENGLTFYRPRLDMLVESFSIDTDEAGAETGWTLSLREQ